MDIGSYLVSLLERKGLTQKELADMCNMTQATISHICVNRRRPSIETLEKICIATGESLSDFFLYGEKADQEIISKVSSLSVNEARLVEIYRHLSNRDQKIVDVMVQNMAEVDNFKERTTTEISSA